MFERNSLTPTQIASITTDQVYEVYSGKPGCACGCRGQYRVHPSHLAFADKNRGYAHDPKDVNLTQVKKVLRIVQEHIAAGLNGSDVCVSEDFASVTLDGTRVYTFYIMPETAKKLAADRKNQAAGR